MTTTVAHPSSGLVARLNLFDWSERTQRRVGYLLLAAIAYLPVLLSAPGRVAGDSKQYMYLDPGRLLERAPHMWDTNLGLGTVSHQNIGYLFPMGPYYWLMDAIGMPDWVTQRLWLGTIYFAAGVGVLYLMRTLQVRGPGAPIAALVYMLTPFSLTLAARLSVILLPFAGLPWLLALTVRSFRSRSWRYPAAFAIVVQIVGGINATALVFVGIAPALWIVYATFVSREVDWRRALATVGKIALLTLLTSLWWIAGLSLQAGYGLNILKYTETLDTVAEASTSTEVLRGFGYWFFYGRDKLGPWTESSVDYTQHVWLILVSYAVPALALLAAGFARWRHRAFFVALTIVGVAIAVGAYPYDSPSPLGSLFKSFALSSTSGLALRSTPRAAPLIVLGLAVLLGVGVNALARRWAARGRAGWGIAAAVLVGVLVVVNLPALWNRTFYDNSLQRNREIPQYWREAVDAVDRRPHDTRILEAPGADFAAYTWGSTVDPITPGLTDRPYVTRELVPWGSPAAANLVNALDHRIHEGTFDPVGLAPVARLLAAGDVLVRSDIAHERYNLARPRRTWALFQPPPTGLGAPELFGEPLTRRPAIPQLDEVALSLPPDSPQPPPVARFPVEDARPIVRAQSAQAPLVVSGDGEGLVDLASLGLLDPDRAILYSASLSDRGALERELDRDAVLVVTDSNRKRGRHWGSIRDVLGHTERRDERPLERDEHDNRLDLFTGAPAGSQTVVEQRGATVDSTGYGNVILYVTEQRAARAVDGDVDTAWQEGAFADPRGERIVIHPDEPVTADRVNLVQPLVGPRGRYLTAATLTFDGEDSVPVTLGPESLTRAGQTVTFPKRTFRELEVTIDDTNIGGRFDEFNNAVGFAEIRIRDDEPGSAPVVVDEVVRMPTDLVRRAGAAAGDHPLLYSMSRSRTELNDARLGEDEPTIVRRFDVPDARAFDVRGTARLAPTAPDEVIDAALGLPGTNEGGITARSSKRLLGSVAFRASAAADGDRTTFWSTPFANPQNQWIELALPAPVTFDRLDLAVVADGRHSVPTRVRIEASGETRTVDLAPVRDAREKNAVADVPVTFPPLTGDTIRVTAEQIRPITTIEYDRQEPTIMPVGIAELGVPSVERAPLPGAVPDGCRTDLLRVDGESLPVRVTGDPRLAEARGALDLRRCDPSGATPAPVELGAGDHEIRAAAGGRTGLDVDGLTLASAAGGDALPLEAGGAVPSGALPPVPPGPKVAVLDDDRTTLQLRVAPHDGPVWLVLGQSNNEGWQATVAGQEQGESTLVDGYANGWLVGPSTRPVDATLEWTPQSRIWITLAISGVAMLLCTALALGWRLRAKRAQPQPPPRPQPPRCVPEPARTGSGPALSDHAELGDPLVEPGRTPSRLAIVVGGVAAAAVGAFLVKPWVGLLVGIAVVVVARFPRLRPVLTFGAPGALALAGLYVAVQQLRNGYPSVFEWPSFFERVHVLAWIAVLLLGADVLVEWLRTRRSTPVASDP